MFLNYVLFLIQGSRMRSDDFGFNENDVDNVDSVIDAINDAVSCVNLIAVGHTY